MKLIYNNFGALINFQTLRPDLSLDFLVLRINDLKHTMRLLLYSTQATQVGGLVGYSRGFGHKVMPSRLSSAFSGSVRVARLNPNFGNFGGAPQPGTRVTASAGLAYDDRYFIWDPTDYTQIAASVSWALTVLDDGRTFQQVTTSAGVSRTVALATGHGIAFEGAFAATFGDLRLPQQALYVGGPSGVLRGYEPDEVAGRSYAAVRLEYRHSFVRDLDVNLPAVAWLFYLHGISGGLFAEAALVSPCDAHIGTSTDAAHGVTRNLFGDLGYSLRFHGDFFGVSQSVFNIDVAVPLVRSRDRSCFGATPPPPEVRFPVGFSVFFGPVW